MLGISRRRDFLGAAAAAMLLDPRGLVNAGRPPRRLASTGLWQWLRGIGLERFELLEQGADWILRGSILSLWEQVAREVRYEVLCGPDWQTKNVGVSLSEPGAERSLQMVVEGGRWYIDGREAAWARGCVDVDLGWSPSTNTLPIRRLQLAVGAGSGPLTMVWIRFPELAVEPLPQEYRRLAERRYRYSSRAGAFVAEIEVDGDGVVVDYGDIWRRVG